MKLYEINEQIRTLLDSIQTDEETGEVVGNIDDIMSELDKLEMDRMAVLEYLAKVVLNTRAEAAMLKAEEQRLKARRDALARQEERIMSVLDRECDGKKTNLGVATVSYRNVTSLNVTDDDAVIKWAVYNNQKQCIRFRPSEVAKAEVTKLVKNGEDIPGCHLETKVSCSLK